MSNSYNTDGMLILGGENDQKEGNPLDSIECAIAFDVTCWSQESRRMAWIYHIIFGVPSDEEIKESDEEGIGWTFTDTAKQWGWDEEDKQRLRELHEQWVHLKEILEKEKTK